MGDLGLELYSIPRGPSTSTVLKGSTLTTAFFFAAGGWSILRFTSGGREIAAAPIRDARFAEHENVLPLETLANAGSKKSGRLDTPMSPDTAFLVECNIVNDCRMQNEYRMNVLRIQEPKHGDDYDR